MQQVTGLCLCGQSHFIVNIKSLDVCACHCTLCQKWSGGIAMYLEASESPVMSAQSPPPPFFTSTPHGRRYFCAGCGCPLWLTLTKNHRVFVPWTLLELSDLDRRRLVLAAEIYTETQPQFWHLTGQYARLTGKEVEAMDNTCQITLETLTPDRPLQPVT